MIQLIMFGERNVMHMSPRTSNPVIVDMVVEKSRYGTDSLQTVLGHSKESWSDVLRYILEENLNSVAKKQNWGKDLGEKIISTRK